LHKHARNIYLQRLAKGVAREQARKDLPLATYTEAYWKIDLHNLLHFLALRMDSHAQEEIRTFARIIGYQIVRPVLPLVWEAFEDYRLNGMHLTRLEVKALSQLLKSQSVVFNSVVDALEGISNKRERDEAQAKILRLLEG
jgi:thymidylate synthase (FAD)